MDTDHARRSGVPHHPAPQVTAYRTRTHPRRALAAPRRRDRPQLERISALLAHAERTVRTIATRSAALGVGATTSARTRTLDGSGVARRHLRERAADMGSEAGTRYTLLAHHARAAFSTVFRFHSTGPVVLDVRADLPQLERADGVRRDGLVRLGFNERLDDVALDSGCVSSARAPGSRPSIRSEGDGPLGAELAGESGRRSVTWLRVNDRALRGAYGLDGTSRVDPSRGACHDGREC